MKPFFDPPWKSAMVANMTKTNLTYFKPGWVALARNVPGSLVPRGLTMRPLAGPKQVKMAAPRSNETQENTHAFKSA
jgi:hypothetical protein